jgi:uncharacterized protein (DUF58 family)
VSPTPLAVWLLAAAALTALVLPSPVAVGLMAAVLVAAGVDAWLVRGVPELRRTAPPILSRGVPSRLEVVPLGAWPAIRLHQPASADLVVEPRQGEGRLTAGVVALRRGRHRLPPVATRTVGPLRLGAWYHQSGGDLEIIVYPDLPAARRLAADVRVGRFREEGRRSRGPLGIGTEFESIREYQPDDDIRRVNWRATARVGHPMSNTYRVEQERDVVCLVDCGRLMAAPVGDRTRLDAAVDAAAAVAAVADEVGDRVGAVAFADRVLRTVEPRRGGADAVLAAVHDLEPLGVDSDFTAAFRVVGGAKRAFVLVLTDLLDDAAGEPLAAALPVLTRRHSLAVAAVNDEAVAEALERPAATVGEAVATAVAVEIVAARERLIARLAHAGADVIEAPLGGLSARCVAAYLRAKRRARL